MSSPFFSAITAVEQAQARREARLRAVVAQSSRQLEEACRQRSAAGRLAERRTLQVAHFVAYLRAKGLGKDEINEIAGGDLFEAGGAL